MTTNTIFVEDKSIKPSRMVDTFKSYDDIERFLDKLNVSELVDGTTNKELWNFDITGMSESLQYTEYDESYKGFYDWHNDIGSGATSKRKIRR